MKISDLLEGVLVLVGLWILIVMMFTM